MRLFFAVLMAIAARAEAADQIRYIFKGQPMRVPGAQQMSFGLTQEQAARISSLTGGEVNLGNYYFIDRNASDMVTFATEPGYSGKIFPNVPPPVLAIEADPELKSQWWIEKLNVKPAWDIASGKGVTIADCDAGFYYNEPDLNANMLVDLRWDFSDTDHPTVVDDGNYTYHGTAVASIMASVLDGKGTNGIAYNAKIVPFQNYNYASNDKLNKEEATAQCVLKAISTPNVNIIVLENQMANGSSEAFAGTRDAVRLAMKAGIIVVSAAGNASVQLIEEAKDNTGSIIVGANTPNESSEGFSNYGDRVTVGAFGEQLHTLYGPDGKMGEFSGTSGATPQVAGTVALMKEANPMLTPDLAAQILHDTRKLTDSNSKTGGMLDSAAAVQKAKDTAGSTNTTGAWFSQWMFRQQLTAILLSGV
jgi:subtilisin family serine protease